MTPFDLDAAIARGRAAWPTLVVADGDLREYLARRSADVVAPDHLRIADLYLACACVHWAPGAIAAFEQHCGAVVAGALARLDARDLADDVWQVLRDLLFVGSRGGLIASYSGRGSLRVWVRIIATREALRLLRASQRRVLVGDHALLDAPAMGRDDPHLAYLRRHYGEQFRGAFLAAFELLDRKARIALRMSVIDGSSIDEIAAAFGVHRSSAARWLAEARASLNLLTRARLAADLRITPSEVNSVIRLVRSSVDLSLDALLRSRS